MKIVQVTYIEDPHKNKAYLLAQGPQASVIRFVHNDAEQCIANQFLGLPVEYRDGKKPT